MIPIDVKQEEKTGELNYKAICIWTALGFMLDRDTFFKNSFWNKPATAPWYYNPSDNSFEDTVDEFAALLEGTVRNSIKDKKVLLALSGGLDSRTLAVAMNRIGADPCTYGYKFENGFNELQYGKKLAEIGGWDFKKYVIPKGYLWNKLDELANITQCYTEFTHSRQIVMVEDISSKGDAFLLGHWGDVFFDDMGIPDNTSGDKLTDIVIDKVKRQGGIELATELWQTFGLKGNFLDYLKERITELLDNIDISNVNAKVRAFKSMYWTTRWTNVNLRVFSNFRPIILPYYNESICKFVCETKEDYLKGRNIQIEYIKRYNPAMAKVSWHDWHPYNLYNYKNYWGVSNIPRRAMGKGIRWFNEQVLNKKLTLRNWEIQFLGKENDKNLQIHLFDNPYLTNIVPAELIRKYYNMFKEKDAVHYSHPVSMLLTFSVFLRKLNN